MDRKVVIALGGNAIRRKGEPFTIEHQFNRAKKTLAPIVELIKEGYRIVITHGNGPQVGVELFRNLLAADTYPPYPLDVLNAETQGWMGYIISLALTNRMIELRMKRHVTTVITRIIVDKNDPAFRRPTKPIGRFFTEEEMKEVKKKFPQLEFVNDANRGWRVVVPSPKPLEVLEAGEIKKLVDDGEIVIAAGGGGIPIVRENGGFKGVEAVIDKDLASSVLARNIGAEKLVILTEVSHVYLNYGKPDQRPIGEVHLEEIKRYFQEGQFPPGNMGPKVEAAINFLENGGDEVIITSLEKSLEAIHGKGGTRIVP